MPTRNHRHPRANRPTSSVWRIFVALGAYFCILVAGGHGFGPAILFVIARPTGVEGGLQTAPRVVPVTLATLGLAALLADLVPAVERRKVARWAGVLLLGLSGLFLLEFSMSVSELPSFTTVSFFPFLIALGRLVGVKIHPAADQGPEEARPRRA